MTRVRYGINEIDRETTARLASRAISILFFSVRSSENVRLHMLALSSLHAYNNI